MGRELVRGAEFEVGHWEDWVGGGWVQGEGGAATTLAMLSGSDDPGPGGDGRALSAEADITAGGGEGSS